jgi:hypothetical protein
LNAHAQNLTLLPSRRFLTAMGHRVIRVTWRQIVREPELVIARLAGALATP